MSPIKNKESATPDIFDGKRYGNWSSKMKSYMLQKGYSEVVKDTNENVIMKKKKEILKDLMEIQNWYPMAEETTEEEKKSLLEKRKKWLMGDEGTKEFSGRLAKFKKNLDEKEEEALGLLKMYLSPNCLGVVELSTSAFDAFADLQSAYVPKTTAFKGQLLAEYYKLSFNDFKTVAKFKAALDAINLELELVESAFHSSHILTRILNDAATVKSYEVVATQLQIEFDKQNGLNENEIYAILYNHDKKLESVLDPVAAYQTKTNSKKKRDISEVECFKCGKKGHYRNQCERNQMALKLAALTERVEALLTNKADSNYFRSIIDSGCNQTMSPNVKLFTSIIPLEYPIPINLADTDTQVYATHSGNLRLNLEGGSQIKIKGALYVPRLSNTLISVKQLTTQGYKLVFEEEFSYIVGPHLQKLLVLRERSNLYYVPETKLSYAGIVSRGSTNEALKLYQLWHERLGHPGIDKFALIQKHPMLTGIPKVPLEQIKQLIRKCPGCMMGKGRKVPLPTKGGQQSTANYKVGEYVHSDIFGPVREKSSSGEKYMITFLDNASDHSTIFLIENTGQLSQTIINYFKMSHRQTGNKVKVLRTDRGKQYLSNDLKNYMNSEGIIHHETLPYTSLQNPRAERLNRVLLERALSMLHMANLPGKTWNLAFATANFLRNRITLTRPSYQSKWNSHTT